MPTRRNPYADRLHEFAAFAFGDDAAFANRGRWAAWFRERIGPAFGGRVVFEIGCADAEFLTRVAAKHPGTAFVGLDWKAGSLYLGAARVAGLGLANVALLRGRAQDVRRFFADGEVDETWLFHPDPCDRPVELKNRLLAEPFLRDAHAVLRSGGGSTLTLKTDHPGYYQWTLALFGRPEPAGLRANPRLKAKELMRPADLPAASHALRGGLHITMHSPDFWHDDAALAHAAGRAFAGERTPFEERFVQKRRPIYYVEIAEH
jgi:tRNA G46 methylase TrmB